MPSLTSVKYSNKKILKIVRITAIALAAAALIGVGIYLLIRNGVFYKKTETDGKSFTLTEEMEVAVKESDLHQGYMFSRTTKLLMEDRGMDPFVLTWYVIPGTTRSVPAMESAYADAMDQVLLLESYVKEGKRSNAETLIKAIDKSFVNEDGFLVAFRKADDLASDRTKTEECSLYENPAFLKMNESPVSMAATTEYLLALLDFYDKWGDGKLLDRIEDLASKVMVAGAMPSYRAADEMAMPTPIPVTEKSLVTPIPEDESNDGGNAEDGSGSKEGSSDTKLFSLSGIELSSMNLEAMRRATVLLPEYQGKYEEVLSIIKEGKVSDELPLYAWMYTKEGGYMYYTGSEGNVDLVSSLYVMVHLAQVGQLDANAYAWVSEQIYNNGYLYASYNIISGQAGSDVEASEAYPLVLYLAKIQGDDGLFAATYSAMMRNYATLDSSPALYTFFRNVENKRVAVYARENLLMELVLG